MNKSTYLVFFLYFIICSTFFHPQASFAMNIEAKLLVSEVEEQCIELKEKYKRSSALFIEEAREIVDINDCVLKGIASRILEDEVGDDEFYKIIDRVDHECMGADIEKCVDNISFETAKEIGGLCLDIYGEAGWMCHNHIALFLKEGIFNVIYDEGKTLRFDLIKDLGFKIVIAVALIGVINLIFGRF